MSDPRTAVKLDYWLVIYALGISSLVSVVLFFVEGIEYHSLYFWFLLWNLLLALIVPLLAWWLSFNLKKHAWLHFSNILLTIAWLVFLPNSFYIASDLIHAQEVASINLLFNYVFILSCIFNGFIAGYISVYMIHCQLLKRIYYRYAHVIIAMIFVLCGFAIYMGRYLRWNSWDIVSRPAGILFDLSSTIVSPSSHPGVLQTTLIFFALIGSIYVVIWQIIKLLRKPQ